MEMTGIDRKFGSFKNPVGTGNLMLLILFIILLVETFYFFPVIKTENELLSLLQNGKVDEKILAIQILANQGKTWQMNEEVLEELLGSSSSIMREFAMTSTVTRFLGNQEQIAYLRELKQAKEKIRCSFFLKFQVGTRIPMKLKDLSVYLETLK